MQAGDKFSAWTVVDPTIVRKNNARHVRARCECGTERLVQISSLKHGTSHRCRLCAQTERYEERWLSALSKRIMSVRQRCQDPNSISYPRYGLRGVEFRFANVREATLWVAENLGRPKPGQSLDRIDPSGHYEPGNLRWATAAEQQRNRCDNVVVSWRGEQIPVVDMPAPYEVSVMRRLARQGLTGEQIIERARAVVRRKGRAWKQVRERLVALGIPFWEKPEYRVVEGASRG